MSALFNYSHRRFTSSLCVKYGDFM